MFLENSHCSLDVASSKGSCGEGVDPIVALSGDGVLCGRWGLIGVLRSFGIWKGNLGDPGSFI